MKDLSIAFTNELDLSVLDKDFFSLILKRILELKNTK